MLRQLMVILYATICIATAAPYVAVTSTDDNNGDESSHVDLPLSADDVSDQDNEDNNVDIAESPPEASYLDSADEDVEPRSLRTTNFLRFGRSSSGGGGGGGAAGKAARSNEERNARFSRGGEVDDNFIRLGRSANFIRLGRRDAEVDAKALVTRGANSNFIRLGRTKTEPSNFIRFGRGGSSGFIRFGRDGEHNFGQEQRFGNASLERLARSSKADSNFIRFGRDKLLNSNFMRLGRSDNFLRFGKGTNFLRFGRGSTDNFIRFGRGKSSEALFGRGKLTDRNFIRLGRSGSDSASRSSDAEEGAKPGSQYVTFGKRVPDIHNVNNKFLRFGRDAELVEENPQTSHNRSKRSLVAEDGAARADYNDDAVEDAALPFRYYSSMANAPFTPEFTVLPSFYTKRATGGNFIRFG